MAEKIVMPMPDQPVAIRTDQSRDVMHDAAAKRTILIRIIPHGLTAHWYPVLPRN